jgi:hypothetical protein
MLIKVIYPDGTFGMARSSSLGRLVRSHEIIAFQCSEGWVEVRRKQDQTLYKGPERRVIKLFH